MDARWVPALAPSEDGAADPSRRTHAEDEDAAVGGRSGRRRSGDDDDGETGLG